MGFLRVMGLLLVALLAIYVVLSIWLRLAERRRLAEAWEAQGTSVGTGDREDFIAAGMAAYDRSLRRRLPWLVVVLPMAGLTIMLYVLNVE